MQEFMENFKVNEEQKQKLLVSVWVGGLFWDKGSLYSSDLHQL